ncbi:phage antirepressor KilAC domain-containing protein [Fibrella forsythiae]|uniref:Phage antirepressor KilAC domain-containing protein n=1 Tax=Fibrella forsythiae TaxID=2817061 RepID=A0ABS3JDK8_9BACT|nr:phage antirepressor KilAC domain-containing protein [Fibrella forsythiae]MBO0947354.1 phage antirepressor KilAC domain-containing protein [Fibrella forsythiae]
MSHLAMQLQFDDITLNVRPHAVHEWALTSAEVAVGYGVSAETIRYHKSTHSEELIEGKHFVSVRNPNAVRNQADTYWTKRGVVRLGFFIKSDRAKRFRDWAEDLVLKVTETLPPAPHYLPQTMPEALRMLAAEIEAKEQVELQLKAAKPKIEQYDRTMNAEGTFTIAQVAQQIGTGQNRLFAFLRAQRIVFYQREHNRPYQQYVDLGWFLVRQKSFDRGGVDTAYPQLFVTSKGLEAIRKKWDMLAASTLVQSPAASLTSTVL